MGTNLFFPSAYLRNSEHLSPSSLPSTSWKGHRVSATLSGRPLLPRFLESRCPRFQTPCLLLKVFMTRSLPLYCIIRMLLSWISPVTIQTPPRMSHLTKKPTEETEALYLPLSSLLYRLSSSPCHSKMSQRDVIHSQPSLIVSSFSPEHTPSGSHLYHSSEIALWGLRGPPRCRNWSMMGQKHPTQATTVLLKNVLCFLWHWLLPHSLFLPCVLLLDTTWSVLGLSPDVPLYLHPSLLDLIITISGQSVCGRPPT